MAKERRRKSEEGGLLLVLMVGVAVMLIGVSVAMQAWSATWRRDSEEELIFRGNQYVDAIAAYHKDNGRFPAELDDLMKIGPRQVRYIRKLFLDPVNPEKQWGLLYLMPGGNAIYDPVAAQQAAENPPDEGIGGDSATVTGMPKGMGGITPISMDPMGTGMAQNASSPLLAPGQAGAAGTLIRPGGRGTGALPGAAMAGGGLRGGAAAGALRGGGMGGGMAGGMGMGMGGFTGGVLPPPKPKGSSFDEDSASEPPIGWPIVGVISRAKGEIADKTFKVYKGHEKVNEWQFHFFDRNVQQQQAPMGAVPGGSAAPFIGPGFGGDGRIKYGGQGNGPRPGMGGNWPGGQGGRGGRGQVPPGDTGGGRQWPPPKPPGSNN